MARLVPTAEMTLGPFFPREFAQGADDLTRSDGKKPPGEVIEIVGRVTQADGKPLDNLLLEIWQADAQGRFDTAEFAGWGRAATDAQGNYRFRTIKPGLYTGRTRHIHFKVKVSGLPSLTSQLYFLGESQNSTDSVLNGIQDVQARNSVIVPFVPIEGSAIGALAARFDIVLSSTPATVPVIAMTNMTDPTRTGYRVGDNWRDAK